MKLALSPNVLRLIDLLKWDEGHGQRFPTHRIDDLRPNGQEVHLLDSYYKFYIANRLKFEV